VKKRRHNTESIIVALLVTVILSACIERPESGVSVKSLAADLVFGIPPVEEPAAPANFGDTPVEDPVGVVSFGGRPGVSRPAPEDPNECREAELTAFPEEATVHVSENPPEAGTWRWKIAGNEKVEGVGDVPKNSFASRKIIESTKLQNGNFRYTTEEAVLRLGASESVRTRFEVRTASSGAAEGETGIFLTRIQTLNSSGNVVRTFTPVPAVLFFPLPARIGDQIDSTGVDSSGSSLAVLQHRGLVEKRQRFDACGTPVDSWWVNGDEEFTSSSGSYERDYDYGIATQFGGWIVIEHIESPTTNPKLVIDAHIADTNPTN
jgi:hypothetical protein